MKVIRDLKVPQDSSDVSQLADDKSFKQRVNLVVVHAADQPWNEPPSKAALEMIPMIRDLRDDTSAILPAGLHMVRTTQHYAFTIACTSISDGGQVMIPCQKMLALVRSTKNSKATSLGSGYKLITPDVEDLLSTEDRLLLVNTLDIGLQRAVSHSAISHRAGGLTSCSSADSHHAVDVSPDTTVAVLSYNVGIQQDGAQ